MISTFDAVPLWLLAVLLFAALLAFFWTGLRMRRQRRRDGGSDEGYILSAALGLLALLIAFTFGLALNRHEERRQAVVAEANAIGTAWLRTDLLPLPEQAQARTLLRRYVDIRLALARAGGDLAAARQARREAARLQADYWRVVAAAVPRIAPASIAGPIMQAANDMLDLGAARHAALDARVPESVLIGVIAYALIGAQLMGYALGAQRERHLFACAVLFLLLTLAIGLIFDLDRPRSGTITVSQQPLLELRAQMGG